MSRDTVINLDSAFVVDLVAPLDVILQDPLDNTDDGSVSTFKAYDPGKDSVLVSAIAGTGVLPIDPAGQFSIGDVLEVTEDDGTLTEGTVSAVDTTANTVTIGVSVTAAAAGNRVRAVFGTAGSVEISMTEYGTPELNSLTYGFRATLPWNHARMHKDNQEVDIEIRFVGDAGPSGSLNRLFVICATVKKVCT